MRIEEIAASSDRIETLIFGAGDYAASQHMPFARWGTPATIRRIFGITQDSTDHGDRH